MGKFAPVVRQFLVIGCCNLLTLSFGSSLGWATINYVSLQENSTTFPSGPLSMEDATLVVSIYSIGGLAGNCFILFIAEKIGLKSSILALGAPQVISVLLIVFAQNKYHLYISRVLSGFTGGGLVVCIPMFIADISHDKIRGALNSMFDPSFNVGILLAFLLGNYFNYAEQAKIQLIVPIIFIIILIGLPESPEFLRKQQKEKRAAKSHKFFKGSTTFPEANEFLSETEKIDFDETPGLKLTDFAAPQSRKALFITFSMLFLSCLAGVMTILSYVTAIFTKTGSKLSPNDSSVLITIIQIMANFVMLNIVERVNRKILYISSSILTALGFLLFGVHCLFWLEEPMLEWMPVVCTSFITFVSCMGLLPIPYIVTVEIFPKKIRHASIACGISLMWIFLFVSGSLYPPMEAAFGLHACMFFFAAMCLLNAIFGVYYLPETRGKSYEEIMELLAR